MLFNKCVRHRNYTFLLIYFLFIFIHYLNRIMIFNNKVVIIILLHIVYISLSYVNNISHSLLFMKYWMFVNCMWFTKLVSFKWCSMFNERFIFIGLKKGSRYWHNQPFVILVQYITYLKAGSIVTSEWVFILNVKICVRYQPIIHI